MEKTAPVAIPWAKQNKKQKEVNETKAAKLKQAKDDGLLPKARKGYIIFCADENVKVFKEGGVECSF